MTSTTTTSALVVSSAGGDPSLTDVVLNPLKPYEALIEIHATGICHTDVSCMEGKLPAEFPNVLGHEGGGKVLQIGNEVDNVQVGDHVLLSYNFCGNCSSCPQDPAYCEQMVALNFGGRRADGTQAISLPDGRGVFCNFFGQSCFSRLAIVSKASLVPVPADIPLDLFAPLGCGLQTGAGTIFNTLNVKPGTSVAVFGVGSVGLSAIMAAKIRNAKSIIAIDLQQQRLDLAAAMGATHTILGNDPNLSQRIKEICLPRNGLQFALDCSGVPKVIETMVDLLGTRGRASSVGAPAPGTRAGVDVFFHLTSGREYVGCHQGDSIAKEMIPYLISKYKEGQYPLDKIISYYDLKDYQKAFDDMKSGKVIKPVLRWI